MFFLFFFFFSSRRRHTRCALVTGVQTCALPISLLAVLAPPDANGQWLGVQNIMREEARAEAEAVLHKLAAHVNEYAGIIPELVIREGRLADELQKFIVEDKNVAIMVLAASADTDGYGPLVSSVESGVERECDCTCMSRWSRYVHKNKTK